MRVDEVLLSLPIFITEPKGQAVRRALEPLGFDFQSWRGLLIGELLRGLDRALLVDRPEQIQAWRGQARVSVVPGYSPSEMGDYFDDRWAGRRWRHA